MKIKGIVFSVMCVLLPFRVIYAQTDHRADINTRQYKTLQHKLATGWNTWYNNSVTSYVLLPESFSINLGFTKPGSPDYLRNTFITAEYQDSARDEVVPGIRSDDGYYTSLIIRYKGQEMSIQTAQVGSDEVMLVSTIKGVGDYLVVEAGLLWGRPGLIGKEDNSLVGRFPGKTITVKSTSQPVRDSYVITSAPHLTFSLAHELGIYTGRSRTLPEIKALIKKHREVQQQRIKGYGKLSKEFEAIQTSLVWNTIYDAGNRRVIVPVSRGWGRGSGGYVLFDWDTYFNSYMLSLFNKDLGYADAVEMTKAITPSGFVPNFQSPFKTSWDRSQPPIGSTVILQIYKKYKEKWLLEEVYNNLLTWNRWWPIHRGIKGYLAWGSDRVPPPLGANLGSKHDLQAAKFESGLDNSPMYDSVLFNPQTSTMELADVGLLSFYIADCHSLAEISNILGKKNDAQELTKRAESFEIRLSKLWDNKSGIFKNEHLDNNQLSNHISPTSFYPMLAKACSPKQADRMIKGYYFNKKEFYGDYMMPSIARSDSAFIKSSGGGYWRGNVWGPMNFLVYLGMRNYPNCKRAREDMVEKSDQLFMYNWKKTKGVYENYNAITGEGSDAGYNWGALLAFMEFIENGYF